jgi:hypothetical protein
LRSFDYIRERFSQLKETMKTPGRRLRARAKPFLALETTDKIHGRYPSATFDEPEAAQTWLAIAPDQSFFQVGKAVAEKMTLNHL